MPNNIGFVVLVSRRKFLIFGLYFKCPRLPCCDSSLVSWSPLEQVFFKFQFNFFPPHKPHIFNFGTKTTCPHSLDNSEIDFFGGLYF